MRHLPKNFCIFLIPSVIVVSCWDSAGKAPTPEKREQPGAYEVSNQSPVMGKKPRSSEHFHSPRKRREDNYTADRLVLFTDDIEGVQKKKTRIANEYRNAMILTTPQRVGKSLLVPDDALISFGIGVAEQSIDGKGDGILFRLHVKRGDAGENKIFERYIDAKNTADDRRWFDAEVDLAKYANMTVTLIFEVLGSRETVDKRAPNNTDDFAVISDPTLVTRARDKKEDANYNVVLLSIDTLRADHLGCYGYSRPGISPNIDAIAKKGVLFEQAISQAPWTTPSHMSMLTGLLPSFHRVNESYLRFHSSMRGKGGGYRILAEDIATLPEKLRANGYRTFAITSGGTVAGQLGFHKGFDVFWETPLLNKIDFLDKWFQKNRNEKFFMFLHTMRVHAPYMDFTYAEEVMSKEHIKALSDYLTKAKTNNIGKSIGVPSEDDAALIFSELHALKKMGLFNARVTKTLYDGGINTTDGFVGRLVEALKRNDLGDNTIVIVTSDHGEEFADRDPEKFYDYHGRNLFDEMIRVPLIMLLPEPFPRGKQIVRQVRLIDIMPTVLELLDIEHEKTEVQGVSLLNLMKNQEDHDPLIAVTEATASGPEKKSLRTNSAKYICENSMTGPNNWERIFVPEEPDKELLYNLILDPGEKRNLADEESEEMKLLSSKLKGIMRQAVQLNAEKNSHRRTTIDAETKKRLIELGYISH